MPTRDLFHEAVRQALERDGWTITHDPYALAFGQHNLYVDLGAERILAAEKADERIAVEIKSFSGKSEIRDLETAVGQYVVYRTLLQRQEPERRLFLAVAEDAFERVFTSAVGEAVTREVQWSLIVFDPLKGTVVRWET